MLDNGQVLVSHRSCYLSNDLFVCFDVCSADCFSMFLRRGGISWRNRQVAFLLRTFSKEFSYMFLSATSFSNVIPPNKNPISWIPNPISWIPNPMATSFPVLGFFNGSLQLQLQLWAFIESATLWTGWCNLLTTAESCSCKLLVAIIFTQTHFNLHKLLMAYKLFLT